MYVLHTLVAVYEWHNWKRNCFQAGAFFNFGQTTSNYEINNNGGTYIIKSKVTVAVIHYYRARYAKMLTELHTHNIFSFSFEGHTIAVCNIFNITTVLRHDMYLPHP